MTEFTNNQLKDLLKQFSLSVSGSKAELVARLDEAFTRDKWLAMMQKKARKVRKALQMSNRGYTGSIRPSDSSASKRIWISYA